jgi:hypothetical protein
MGLLDDAIREHLELKRQRGADAVDISREESEALAPVRRGPDRAPDLSGTSVPAEAPAEVQPDAPSWDSEQTAVLGPTPVPHDDPPASLSAFAPPPAPAYEPSAPPATTGYKPPPVPAYEPPGASPPPPAEPERPWFERAHDVPEQEGEDFGLDPKPDLEPEPEPEHTSLLARFRVGRKHKGEREPAPSGDEPSSAFEPPPLPAGREPASPYEPPPSARPPSHAYEPPPPAHHHPDIVAADDEPDVEEVLEETPDFLEETPEHDRLWFEQRPPRDFDFDDK